MKVKLRENMRTLEFDATDFRIKLGEIKELELRNLRSYDVRNSLFQGHLLPVEGELLTKLKHASILFTAEDFPFCYGKEFGKYFKRDIEMQTTVWLKDVDVPYAIKQILDGASTEMRVETPTEDEPEEDVIEMPQGEEEPVEEEPVEETNEKVIPDFKKMKKDEINDWAAINGFGEEIKPEQMTKKEMITKLEELLA